MVEVRASSPAEAKMGIHALQQLVVGNSNLEHELRMQPALGSPKQLFVLGEFELVLVGCKCACVFAAFACVRARAAFVHSDLVSSNPAQVFARPFPNTFTRPL